MADRHDDRLPEAKMDVTNLYREEIVTDRKVGTIRVLTPIKSDGSADPGRKVSYVGEAQLLTSVGTLPLSFEIEADNLTDAVAQYGPAAKKALEQAMRELEELRRQAASSLVIPRGGASGLGGGFGPGGLPGGLPGGGKIQLP
ncbi:MAG: hypothetical protein DI596_04965 [Azospira oryzae]|uniref:Cytoplasmic protein n=1 Tax=Pelomicrobium methylotrophicum TaxID=2602750 RepID=A0A5C7EUC4_9PROT|nr:hypothetical protein [Pelomicrobium methylotrophicum]PZP61478.1 MAG: hypothetical protein DI596_04965 [Azospira oryzae]PZP81090.1 MAG: hypothetical protein DI593_04965 [Azospira oryzae]TXF10661.1 hypothetical protein FR698_14050 [Pelomicrobium methylotrophicum]